MGPISQKSWLRLLLLVVADAIPDEACDTSLVYNFNLNAAQTGAINFPFDGELLGFAVTNNWTTSGGSWPGDMGLQLCDPSGTCGFIEGFNIDLTGTNLGDWPFNWNTTSSGFLRELLHDAARLAGRRWELDADHSEWLEFLWRGCRILMAR